jgi:hypothetical protein
MSIRALLLLVLVSSPMVASAATIETRSSLRKRCLPRNQQVTTVSCTLHSHHHEFLSGVRYGIRNGGCVRKFRDGRTQVWRPATTRIQFCQVRGPDRFRTVTRYRTVFRCGVPVRRAFRERVRVPGRMRKVPRRVHVAGAWILQKPACGIFATASLH